jgi:hypothetical protein
MQIDWTADPARIDWNELSALYRMAPLGDKAPADLELVFGNSMFRALALRSRGPGRDCLATSQCIRRIREVSLLQAVRHSSHEDGNGDPCRPGIGVRTRLSGSLMCHRLRACGNPPPLQVAVSILNLARDRADGATPVCAR